MWRAVASRLLRRRSQSLPPAAATAACTLRHLRFFSLSLARPGEAEVTAAEPRRLVRLVGVEAFKRRLRDGRDEVVGSGELLDACVEVGAARTQGEEEALARAMDDAGVVLLFRDKAYLHPEKLMYWTWLEGLYLLHSKKEEFKQLQEKKKEIDKLAHKQVRRILWSGLGFFMCQVGLFFRLDILGVLVRCDGADRLLRNHIWPACRLCLFPHYLKGSDLSRLHGNAVFVKEEKALRQA